MKFYLIQGETAKGYDTLEGAEHQAEVILRGNPTANIVIAKEHKRFLTTVNIIKQNVK